jgi:hypothetical protein
VVDIVNSIETKLYKQMLNDYLILLSYVNSLQGNSKSNISNTKSTDSSLQLETGDNSVTLKNVTEDMLQTGINLPVLSDTIYYEDIQIKVNTQSMTDVTYEELDRLSIKKLQYDNAVGNFNDKKSFIAFQSLASNTDTISSLSPTQLDTTGLVKTYDITLYLGSLILEKTS